MEVRSWADNEQCKLWQSTAGCRQWRRQDLLRGGAKLEIRSWGIHGKLQGRVQQLNDDNSFVTMQY